MFQSRFITNERQVCRNLKSLLFINENEQVLETTSLLLTAFSLP